MTIADLLQIPVHRELAETWTRLLTIADDRPEVAENLRRRHAEINLGTTRGWDYIYNYARSFREEEYIWRDGVKVFSNPLDFAYSEYGMAARPGSMWPAIERALDELSPGRYYEAMAVGGIGTGKTHLALYHLAFETQRLVALRDPHAHFDLDKTSEIVMIFQSVTAGTAKSVDYDRFRFMLEAAPWFQANGPFDKDLKSQVRFTNTNVQVRSISSKETGAIGQNVIGGMIDEINYMQLVERSARTHDGTLYDQAQANYNAIARRRESRFSKLGDLAGMLWLVSSRRYPGQFTDKKEEEIRRQVRERGRSRIFLYDKRVWEAKPPGTFKPERFYVFVGDRTRKPFIVADDQVDEWRDDPLVDAVPTEFRDSYENDIYSSLRDISGRSTQAENPYIPNVEAINAMFHGHDLRSCFSVETTNLVKPVLHFRRANIRNPKLPRWAHVDLGLTSDSAGVCVAHVAGFKHFKTSYGTEYDLPVVHVDGVLEIPPIPGGQIPISDVRDIIMVLKKDYGMNIVWVTYDSYESAESIQTLRRYKFKSEVISADRSTDCYDSAKRALLDGRVKAPPHSKLDDELRGLILDTKKGKVDHPPHGSKDCADAWAVAVWGASTRRLSWDAHNRRFSDIPEAMQRLGLRRLVEDDEREAA